ncbi:trehalase [Leptinotarsa decemlineata]|uniref:trehalase n=1 Tax=Leptinotarsa decemlineata TaxID=7539 RepID=UPI003D30C4A6
MKRFSLLLIAIVSYKQVKTTTIQSCDSLVYCQGELLDTVQKARLFNDSKTFVDLIQKKSENETLSIFKNFMKVHHDEPTVEEVRQFVEENFDTAGELDKWIPTDYKSNPKFLKKIKDITVRDFARTLVSIWPQLARKVNDFVSKYPDRHSLIPLPNGFIIPGGRFKEIYYWDSYWIVKGLIISEMTETVRGIIENLLSLVEKYGFVPNGSRVYYLNRSQPPLLTLMAGLYMDATNDLEWLKKHIGLLERELNWWLVNRAINVEVEGQKHQLCQYASHSGTPRPESYSEDLKTCSIFENEEKEICYKNLKSGAESGWDFSSRWLFTETGDIGSNLTTIDTKRVIPVDLNAFLCGSFKRLADFYERLENKEKFSKYLALHESWKESIESVFYDGDDGIWYDYDIKLSKHRKGFFPSNLAPLWAKAFDTSRKDQYGERAAKYLKSQKIDEYLGGIPMSLTQTGEQWDLPNAWPPLQEIVILGLKESGNSNAVHLSKVLAKNCVNSYIRGYAKSNEMFEKYDALSSGEYGGGGEYIVQTGFGWTNGVALSFINEYYTENPKKD